MLGLVQRPFIAIAIAAIVIVRVTAVQNQEVS